MNSDVRAQRLILRGGVSAGAGLVLRLGARLLFLFLAARLFGAALFGAFSVAVAVVELAVAVGGLGMKRYLFKLLEERGERAEGHVLLDAALLVTMVSLLLGAAIALVAFADPGGILARQTALALVWIAPMVAGQALLDLFLSATRWKHRMRYEVVARSLVEPYLGAAGMVAAWYAGFTGGLVIGYAVGTLGAVVYAVLGTRSAFGGFALASYRPNPTGLVATLRETALPTATDAVAAFFYRADIYLVGVLLGEAPSGIYSMARQLRTPIRQVRQSFDGLLTPVVAKTLSANGAASTAAAIATATRMILAIQLVLVLTLVVLGRPALDWFGPEFAPAYAALLLLAAAETIQGAFSIGDLLLLYLRARLALAVTCAMIVVHLASAVPLIEAYGIDGAAMSVLLAIFAGALFRRWLLHTHFGAAPPLLHGAGPLLAAGLATIVAVLLRPYSEFDTPHGQLFAALGVVLAVYGVALFVWQRATRQSFRLTGFQSR